MSLQFEILNGNIVESGKPFFSSSNRSFQYGDGLFETMRVSNGKALFLNDHLERLQDGMNYLQIKWPSASLYDDVLSGVAQMITLNKKSNLRLRLTVFRETGGYYKPSTEKSGWLLSGEELNESYYPVEMDGLNTGLFMDEFKHAGKLGNLKTINSLLYILAALYARDRGWDETLLMNTNSHIIEASSSNIFIRKGQVFITPPLSDGCLNGVMRKNVISLLLQNGEKVEERCVDLKIIEDADEMLLTNVISGIRWVKSFQGKNYENVFAGKINRWLNEQAGDP